MSIFLDVRARGADGSLIAAWKLDNKPVLQWQLEFLESIGANDVVIVGDREVYRVEAGSEAGGSWVPLPGAGVVLGVADVHRWDRLRKIIKGKLQPEHAHIFRITQRGDLQAASDEWTRNSWIPIGRFYVRPIAHRLALLLSKTPVHPNQITLGTLFCGIAVCVSLALDLPYWRVYAPFLVILGWILDWTDGRLSRLKNCRSRFGGYLDATVGDLTEDLCYLGLILYLYRFDAALSPYAFIAGTFYFFGKYQAYLSLIYQRKHFLENQGENFVVPKPFSRSNAAARIFVFFEDSDIRQHFLALSLAFGVPALPLFFYVAHFHLRWMLRVALVTARNLRPQ